MKLSQEQVEHLADLARIKLTDVETVKFGNQLSGVLEYVKGLGQVDTEGVEMTSRVTGLVNVWREDHPQGCDAETREMLIKNIPEREGDLVKVRGVFETSAENF